MAKSKPKHLSYISVPSPIIPLQAFLISPKKSSRSGHRLLNPPQLYLSLLLFLILSAFLFIGSNLDPIRFSPLPCSTSGPSLPSTAMAFSSAVTLPDAGGPVKEEATEEFWRQPEGYGYRPCLDFTPEYRRASAAAAKDRSKYLMVVVSGGMNQQRNQIVDAVVIARILGAALVVPVLQVNVIWGDESEFSDIFDLEHFKRELAGDVRVVSSLPSTHLMSRPVEESRTPLHASPRWIRSKYSKRLNKEGVLLLRGLDSRLSKDLPPDLQKLRCKVAFRALKFAAPIQELGDRLAARMRGKGPYLALHLRMEKDVWVRTGCLPGLSRGHDETVRGERRLRPELLTARSNMTSHQRKLAGLCPLNAIEVTRLLKALDAPRDAMIYWAGGEPFGGPAALRPLTEEFPNLYSKGNLSLPGELEPFKNKASSLAAVDYIVCERSDAFMPSHGGNMGHMIQGHRAFAGHRKFITPNKRQMLPYFLDDALPETEFNRIVKGLHADIGQRPDATAAPAGATEVIEDRPVEEHISTGVAPNQRQRDATCSIYKVPPSISGADPSAYTPKVVTIGPGHYIKDPTPDSYRDMQYCKRHALDFFKSRLPDSQILLRLLREEVETIRNCYAYEIPLNTDELAEVMMMDGCFILYLILKGRQSYYDLGGIPIRYQPVKHDLLLLENQIPFFVLKKLHDKLGIEADGRIDLVARALGFLQDVDLPRNKRTVIEPEVSVSHLLDLVHLSMLPDTCPLDPTDPGWRIPSATELREYGMAFEKREEAQSFLDVNVRRRGLTRRTVMEIPPLALYDITLSLFRNLIAFEQCHPAAGLHVTDYVAFMACIIHTKADVRLLHLNGILVNWMTGDHDLTKFFRCLCTGAHTTDDRSYLVDVFKAVSEYKKRYLWWVRFKRGCRDKWAIIAILIGFLITVLTIFNTVFGVVVHLK